MSYAFPLHIDWHCLCGDALASHDTKAEGERCVGHCQHTDRDCRHFGYRPIMHDARTPAISAIFTAAGEQGWPKHYTCDLSTDYQWLIGPDRPTRFIWILRESGTHLFSLDNPDGTMVGYTHSSLGWLKDNHPEALVFYWDGMSLIPHSYDQALQQPFGAAPVPAVAGRAHVSNGGYGFKDWLEYE